MEFQQIRRICRGNGQITYQLPITGFAHKAGVVGDLGVAAFVVLAAQDMPAEISPIAYQNKAVVYDLLFRSAAETLLTIAPRDKPVG